MPDAPRPSVGDRKVVSYPDGDVRSAWLVAVSSPRTMSEGVLQREEQRRRRAVEIVSTLGLMERWADFGVPKLVGAAAYGLMVAPDIDIEIYCTEPKVEMGFSVVSEVARIPGIWKVRFSNELDAPDHGLYWQLRYRPSRTEVWKIDMWLLAGDHPGPRSDDLVEAMDRALTEETRIAILTIKEAIESRNDVHSINIYEAVLDDGVRSTADFLTWHAHREPTGLTAWRPSQSHP